jgi:hypothetical protein
VSFWCLKRGQFTTLALLGTQLDHNAIEEIRIMISSLFEHDLFGKPVSTFPDHALAIRTRRAASTQKWEPVFRKDQH